MNSEQTPKIALLNDLARVTLCDCRVVVTPGIAEMGQLDAIITKVQAFDGFTERNDPYGEHDFGSVEHNGQTVFWKFDYYDVDMLMHLIPPMPR